MRPGDLLHLYHALEASRLGPGVFEDLRRFKQLVPTFDLEESTRLLKSINEKLNFLSGGNYSNRKALEAELEANISVFAAMAKGLEGKLQGLMTSDPGKKTLYESTIARLAEITKGIDHEYAKAKHSADNPRRGSGEPQEPAPAHNVHPGQHRVS